MICPGCGEQHSAAVCPVCGVEATPPPSVGPPTTRRYLVFQLSCLVSFILYVHRYTFGIVRPMLEEEYGYSNTELETIGSIFYLGYTFASVPAGMIADLFGTHLFLGSIIIVWSLLLPLIGLKLGILGLSAVRVLFGVAQSGTYPALGNVSQRWFPASRRTSAQGWIASFAGRTGGAMAPILMASFLIGALGLSWQFSLVVMAAVGLVFGVFFLRFFRSSPEEDPHVNEAELALIREGSTESGAERGVMPFGRAMRNRSMQIIVFQQFFNAGADVIYTNTLGSFFKKQVDLFAEQGASIALVGLLVAAPLLGGACGGAFGGYLNEFVIHRVGRRRGRSLIGCAGKSLAAITLFAALRFESPIVMAALLFVTKFFTDWTQPTIWGTCTDIGGKFSATVFSIVNMSGNFGALVLPILVVGPLLDAYSTTNVAGEMVTNFTPMFVLMGVCYVVSAVCWLFIDCTREIGRE